MPTNHISLTKYCIKKSQGSSHPSTEKTYAIYALPFDEMDLTIEQAERTDTL